MPAELERIDALLEDPGGAPGDVGQPHLVRAGRGEHPVDEVVMASPASEQPRGQELTPVVAMCQRWCPSGTPESSRLKDAALELRRIRGCSVARSKVGGRSCCPGCGDLPPDHRERRERRIPGLLTVNGSADPGQFSCAVDTAAARSAARRGRSRSRLPWPSREHPTGLSALPEGPMVGGPSNARCALLVARDSSRVEGWVS